ncbi:MAG: diaminopimelate epimerase [Chryseobacterium sp.]|nr:MAG: diaminopimelate epimerase [Chryseobacterium sp.]
MNFTFYKYQGTGNDFIVLDNRNVTFPKNPALIEKLCHRRFGVGADGLILLENHEGYDFRMVYYNADGNESSMCGNGGRCTVAFAHHLGIFDEKTRFLAVDGPHEAEVIDGMVKLKMSDVDQISTCGEDAVLNTGSPHFVRYTETARNMDVFTEGRKIRNSDDFITEGINVNFVTQTGDRQLFVRTYERGVEDETYSCGTGVTAAALTFMVKTGLSSVDIETRGGRLSVSAVKTENGFTNIWLAGPAERVFKGELCIEN